MKLRRPLDTDPVTYVEVPLIGFLALYQTETRPETARQGDARVQITNDEIATLGWPGPPATDDLLFAQPFHWAVVGSVALYEGAVCIGHDLHVRGGQ